MSHPPDTYQFSNYQKIHALISPEQLQEILVEMEGRIFPLGSITEVEEISKEQYVDSYIQYLKALDEGKSPFLFRRDLQVMLCKSEEDRWVKNLPGGKLYQPGNPVILVRLCFVGKNIQEKTIHPMVFGPGSIPWGLQFSYPAVVQEKSSGNIYNGRNFPTFSLFSKLQKWMRQNTRPASFFFGDFELKTPLRIDKKSDLLLDLAAQNEPR